MKEPIIVTAFWDVGRGADCLIPRSNQKYYSEFSEWARIKNNMLVFADKQTAEVVKEIRDNYGLLDVTKIVVIEDVFQVEPELAEQMNNIQSKKHSFYYYLEAMSQNAKFDYAWLMKYWCIKEATKYYDKDALFAWMDFGFNHHDVCFSNMKEFSFLWKTNIEEDKIHLFSLRDVENVEITDALQLQFDSFMGVFHIIPYRYAEEFWKLIKDACRALILMECIDDDQMLLLMAYKSRPELFSIHISDWFLPLKECGATHLTTHSKSAGTKRLLSKIALLRQNISFAVRSYRRAKKYY